MSETYATLKCLQNYEEIFAAGLRIIEFACGDICFLVEASRNGAEYLFRMNISNAILQAATKKTADFMKSYKNILT